MIERSSRHVYRHSQSSMLVRFLILGLGLCPLAAMLLGMCGCGQQFAAEGDKGSVATKSAPTAPPSASARRPAEKKVLTRGQNEESRGAESPAAAPGRIFGGDSRQPGGTSGGAAKPAPRAVEPSSGVKAAAHEAEPYEEEPVDPVKANGPIFEGWKKPELAIVFSGRLDGYLEPCGCAGLTNQKGGLARRHTLFKTLEAQGWDVAALDLGGLVKRFGRQQEIKYHSIVDGMKTIGYGAIALGPQDLRLPSEVVFAALAPVGDEPTSFVSANVTVLDESVLPRFKIITAGNKKLGVTSILGAKYQEGVSTDGVEFTDPAKAIAAVLPKLKAAKCDLLILLSHATLAESEELAKRFPDFDFVVTGGFADEPKAQPERIGNTRIVEVGHKGMYVAVVGLYKDLENPIRYQRVPLDHRFKDSEAMKQVMVDYQQQLEDLGFEGLGIRPQPHPSGRAFIGSESCAECHGTAHEIWSDTPHSHATDTLVKLEIPRHFDPECLSCHATGWEPQQYFPYKSGYLSLEKTPLMMANGCENCHGPASAHVAAERAKTATPAQREKLRADLRVKKSANNCLKCHDLDNSPEFVKEGGFDEYWPQVEHYGKD